jgi:hypothetical protein
MFSDEHDLKPSAFESVTTISWGQSHGFLFGDVVHQMTTAVLVGQLPRDILGINEPINEPLGLDLAARSKLSVLKRKRTCNVTA